ncbi:MULTISPECIES: TPR domain-containing glycosyltransferase [unclassified Paenibacillus]|uniref:TPR domain-containing glycosyltransferase n=1 Tax=unclassified Paenibacillus TaxID=185978 RepID=UPI0008BCF2DE|nr:TPR domain-containing glycosyltransferase [Paenibacillus sp. OK076]SEO56244.1 Glycosyltransferase involved in cell wall bisynthesis [Paenibacillus sp. OK076]
MQNRLLGIHMIVQNEEHQLARCLDSFKPIGSECFITDTGSTDRTPEIARHYGATVLHARWEDDFAYARNISLPLASTEWILCLDADEYVIQGLEELLNYLPKVHKSVSRLRITIENRIGEGTGENVIFHPVRLFRAQQGYRYAGRIHEQLVRSGRRDGGEQEGDDPDINDFFTREEGWIAEHEPLAPLRLVHDGYLPSTIAQGHKPLRNLKLLQRELADHPGQPFHLYNVGVTYCQLGHIKQAAEAFTESFLHTPLHAPYRSTLVRDYAKVLLAMGRYDEAHGLLAGEIQRYAEYADLHLIYGEILEQQGLEERAYKSYARATDCREGFDGADLKGESKAEIRGIHQQAIEQTGKPDSVELREGKSFDEVQQEPAQMERHYVTDVGCDSYKAYTSMGRLAQKRGFLQESAHLYSLALSSEITYAPAWTGLADVLQQCGETDESIAETLLAHWKEHSKKEGSKKEDSDPSVITYEDDLALVVYALASSGAYGQALNLLHGDARNTRIEHEDYLYWMLCANRVSDALQYVQNQWSEEHRAGVNLQPEQRLDLALTYWANELSVSESFMAAAEPQEREGWRLLNDLLDTGKRVHVEDDRDGKIVHQTLQAATELSKNIWIRAVQTGQLAFARMLYEKVAAINPEHHENGVHSRWLAAALYRQGYTMAAAELLIQSMSQGDMDADSLFYLGEAVYAKGHYDQALILFQQALEKDSEQRQASAGAAVCYMQLALGVIRQERTRSPADKVLMAQQTVLEQQLRTAEGIPWRTVFCARERRNQLADQAHFIMHDREG